MGTRISAVSTDMRFVMINAMNTAIMANASRVSIAYLADALDNDQSPTNDAMDARVEPLAAILRLNTRLLINCLAGLTDETARVRHGDGVNSATFIAAHVTDSRFFILRTLGGSLENPLSASLDKAKGIDDITEWPALDTIRTAWTDVSAAIDARLEAAQAGELTLPVDARFPGVDRTRLGALTFLVQHDSYHIGQLALLRKPAGLPAMSYR
jgi:uncharacterized damage-inducible protein DinB